MLYWAVNTATNLPWYFGTKADVDLWVAAVNAAGSFGTYATCLCQ